jgi:two-component system, chemotaxis family, CheB/CheR fusion protein
VVFDDSSSEDAGAELGVDATGAELARLRLELSRAHERLAAFASGASSALSHEFDIRSHRGEELHSLVEEMENTREELEAVNEELRSFIDENHYRVTKLAQLSDDLKHLLESTGLATLLVDGSLNIVRFTPLAADIFRIKPSDVGRPLSDLRHGLSYPNLMEDVRSVVRERVDLERETESMGGRWFLVRLQPHRSALHGFGGAVIVLIDITTRKMAEMALREVDRRKDEFLAVLAHELRNPLAPIRAGVEVLRRTAASGDRATVEQVAGVMGRQTQQLARLVDDLLEVGRINSGKLDLRIAPTPIADVVRDAVTAVRPLIESARHNLTTFVPDEPLVVAGDSDRLAQVVVNLLTNAARYTAPGGQIAITAHRVDDHVSIKVKDSGRGISPQALPRLFDMYFQEKAGQDYESGLGIGLTLAKKLVELHSGSIQAESAGPNRGSTFTVRLPLALGLSESGAEERGAGACAQEQRIMIVDDNTDAAQAMSLLLTSIGGGEVGTAFSGEEALELGPRLKPDVVLLDLGMPDMDGYEVARRIRREPWGKDVFLVALTGWGQDSHRHRTQEAGFDRHLTKPAEFETLRAVLSERCAH